MAKLLMILPVCLLTFDRTILDLLATRTFLDWCYLTTYNAPRV